MNSLKTIVTTAVICAALAAPSLSHAQNPDDLAKMQTFLNIMDSYFGIIESTYAVSSSAEKAAIMQMQKIQEVYEQRGEKARAVEILRGVLEDSTNPTIRNAAYMLLSDNLKETGKSDQAIELLRQGLAENIRAAQ
jgi:lipopolysaccharide biosynthesis regulator YciM